MAKPIYDEFDLEELKELQDSDPIVKKIIHEYFLLRPSFNDEENVIAKNKNSGNFDFLLIFLLKRLLKEIYRVKGDLKMNFCPYCGDRIVSASMEEDEELKKLSFEEEVEEEEEKEEDEDASKMEKTASVSLMNKVATLITRLDHIADTCEKQGREDIAVKIDKISDMLEDEFEIKVGE